MKNLTPTWAGWLFLVVGGTLLAVAFVPALISFEELPQPEPKAVQVARISSATTQLDLNDSPNDAGFPPKRSAEGAVTGNDPTPDLPSELSSLLHDDTSGLEKPPLEYVDDAAVTPYPPEYPPANQYAALDPGATPGPGKPWAAAPLFDETFGCIIEPFEFVHVGTALRAVLDSIKVERSDFVTEGQLLAELESDVERSQLAIARARSEMEANILAREESLALGARKSKRAEKLYASSTVSEEILDEIKTDTKVAAANLLQAREARQLLELEVQEAGDRLRRRSIYSPISGVVTERLKSPGEVVIEETILIVAQIDPLAVEVILPAALFGTIELGMRVEVEPEIPDAGVRIASVMIVDRVVDPASGTFAVRLALPNADHSLPSGLHCQARFVAPE